jgi:hypothetical protein
MELLHPALAAALTSQVQAVTFCNQLQLGSNAGSGCAAAAFSI